jgi:peptide-methionine (S)-S-oxide reductase
MDPPRDRHRTTRRARATTPSREVLVVRIPFYRQLLALSLLFALGGAAHAASAAPGAPAPPPPPGKAIATLAMGCFWCAEDVYEGISGIESVVSGYTGGTLKDPTYEQVSGHRGGHYEAIQIVYDPEVIGFEKILDLFWPNVDPLDAGGQFCDRGDQYRAAVFAHDAEQRRLAEASRQRVAQELQKGIVTRIEPAVTFYPAEEYHQDYARRNPLRYRYYRNGCGRDARLEAVWGEKAGGH